MTYWVMGAALVLCLAVSLGLCVWVSRLRDALAAARARLSALERDVAAARRESAQHAGVRALLSQALRQLPHLTRDLHGTASPRRVPAIVLNLLTRVLEAKQAVVLLRRNRSESEPARGSRLVVAAAWPENGPLRAGTEIDVGEGELGYVAEAQRVLDRADLDERAARRRDRSGAGALPGFVPDLAAPMLFEERTLGVLAAAGLGTPCPEAKELGRFVAHLGAMALNDAVAYSRMKAATDVDGVTGVFNKAYLSRALAEEVLKAQRGAASVTVFLFDLDHFRRHNEAHGWAAGDEILKAVARLVDENTRKDNVFGRFGADAFLLIYRGTDTEPALTAAETLRALIAGASFPSGDGGSVSVTVSGGLATCPRDGLDGATLLRAAEEALSAARRGGGNRLFAALPHYLSGSA